MSTIAKPLHLLKTDRRNSEKDAFVRIRISHQPANYLYRKENAVKESKEMLRQRFEAQTDIELAQKPDRWKSYAEWLERLASKKINSELIGENEMLRNKMRKAMNVLEQGVT